MEQGDLFGSPAGDCVFCRIVNREARAWIVAEDDETLAFLDHRPLLRGHVLLIPKAHFETLLDVPADLAGRLFEKTQRLARAVETGLEAHGSFVAVNTKISQTVPHVHVHVVPRWKRDGLFGRRLVWFRRPYRSPEEAREVQEALVASLAKSDDPVVESP